MWGAVRTAVDVPRSTMSSRANGSIIEKPSCTVNAE
jgi:hypothetical protein